MTVADMLMDFNACEQAMEWAAGYTDPQTAWNECQRGDWMLWILGKQIKSPPWSNDRKPLLVCCLDCADTVIHLRSKKQAESIAQAVSVLREWVAGQADCSQAKAVHKSLCTADAAAAYYAAAADAADTAYAYAAVAAYAAYAYADAYAAACAADAYAAVDPAAYVADAAAARKEKLAEYANIVRRHFPSPPQSKVK